MTTLTPAHAALLREPLDRLAAALDHFVEAQTVEKTRTAIDTLAAPLQVSLAKIFRRQGNAVARGLAPLSKYLTESLADDFDRLFDAAILDTSADMSETLQTAVNAAIVAGGKQLLTDFNSSLVFSLTNPRAVAYTRQYAADLITGIDSTSKQQIRQLVMIAVANGSSYAQLARDIRTQYKQFAVGVPQKHIRSRAELIAVTETGNAYQEGNLIAAYDMTKAGQTLEHAWQTVGDRRVSPGCRSNQAASWIDLQDDFPSGHDRPLRFPGCRCVALYRRKA